MVRCLIIDDEPLARQLLAAYVKEVKSLELVGTCETALEAFEILHSQKIDLLFLDIQMPGVNGLSFLKMLKAPPKVIFTTAYSEHAVEAFELDAVDYLVKPIVLERFMKAIQKVIATQEETPQTLPLTAADAIFLKVNKRLLRVEHSDILYIEGLGDYVKVFTPNQVLVSYLTLSKIESLLPAQQFIRIHKSYIINTRHIKFVEGASVRIAEQELPIGITYRESLLQKLSQGLH